MEFKLWPDGRMTVTGENGQTVATFWASPGSTQADAEEELKKLRRFVLRIQSITAANYQGEIVKQLGRIEYLEERLEEYTDIHRVFELLDCVGESTHDVG